MIKVALKHFSNYKEFTTKRFEELFGIAYYPQLEFADWKVEQWLRKSCAKALRLGKVGDLALWLGKLHGKALDNPTIPDITIGWLHQKIGYGVFANRPIKKWKLIGEYTGLVRRRNLFFPNVNDYCFMYPREWIALKAFTIDSGKQGNFTRFINHSDTPNLESVAVFHDGLFHIIVRATEDIPAGSELTYDYGDIYWRRRKKLAPQELEPIFNGSSRSFIMELRV